MESPNPGQQLRTAMDVDLREYRPGPHLRPIVHRFWTGRFNASSVRPLAQQVVPSGFVEVIIHLSDVHCDLPRSGEWRQSPDHTVIGLQGDPYEVRFSREVEVFAIRFKPAGFVSMFGTPLNELAGTHEDLESVLDRRFRTFLEQIRRERDTASRLRTAERYLSRLEVLRDRDYLSHATELIRSCSGRLQVSEVASQVYVSRRQLERNFREKLGVSPKQYIRITRLNAALKLLHREQSPPLADVAYMAGYADQPHFNRDFRRFVGEAPSRYLARRDFYTITGV